MRQTDADDLPTLPLDAVMPRQRRWPWIVATLLLLLGTAFA